MPIPKKLGLIKEVNNRKKSIAGGKAEEAAKGFRRMSASRKSHGILEGISSLHSWIKTQTMIRPTKMNSKKGDGYINDEDDEDVVISLTSGNPNQSLFKVRWNHHKRTWEKINYVETWIDHLNIESSVIHMDSEEAKHVTNIISLLPDPATDKKKKKKKKRRESEPDIAKDDVKHLANQFSYIERATQTPVITNVATEMQTDPPPRKNFNDTVNQWVIYGHYDRYEKLKELEEDKEREKKPEPVTRKKLFQCEGSSKDAMLEEETKKKMLRSAKVLERMVNLNTFDEIAQDFRFWEDACDDYKESEGTLLPLWKFSFDKAEDLEITCLCWNPKYNDLFAAGFGSFNFYNQSICGYVCMFSLKNPSYPEFLCEAPSGVLCVDIHPQHPHMLVTGLKDGNVAVFNLQNKSKKPTHISDARNGKHKDVVWQVRWVKDNLDGYLNFYSVSGDGRVTNWTIVKTCLWYTDELHIGYKKELANTDINLKKHLLDSGRAIAFKPDEDNIFLVGTDEGMIYLATTQYSSEYLMSYQAHSTPIYNIKWNNYIPDIFLTCGAEFVVKIFHKSSKNPILRFDVGSPVGDIAWAPYSSTVFAVVTMEGKVYVYDLHMNKYNPICVQSVVPKRKTRLNNIAFNKTEPIIIVGDSAGNVHALKLSPNLRKRSKDAQLAIYNNDMTALHQCEIKKLNRLLNQVIQMVQPQEQPEAEVENEE